MRIDELMDRHVKSKNPDVLLGLVDAGRLCRELEIENNTLKEEINILRGEQDPLTKACNAAISEGWQIVATDFSKQILQLEARVRVCDEIIADLRQEVESLKKEKEFPTKVDIPNTVKFSTTDEWKINGIVRGEYALTKANKMYDVGMHARETTNVLLEKVCKEDLKPGDIIFDDELSTEYLSDIENYGIILEDMSVAYWSGRGILVEPEIRTVTNQYYKVVIKK